LRKSKKRLQERSLAYVAQMNRAIDFVLLHIDQPLRLEIVAKAAGFSPFHFHRIFRLLIGESLNEFVKRVRLERALVLLSRRNWTARRRPSLTDIAVACGFASSADFSRCFRQRYGAPASRFAVESFRAKRREEWRRAIADPRARNRLIRLKPGANPDGFSVRLRRLPRRTVAYIRVMDPFAHGGVQRAAERLVAWADVRGLANGQWLGYMWDDPEIVPLRKCRYDVALEVPSAPHGGEVGRFDFPEMLVAEIAICGGIDLEMRALDWLFGTWLPASGYAPSEQPCFEAWIGRPFAHGTAHFELRLQLPVERS
jgi:AraC family transcriptional regulator